MSDAYPQLLLAIQPSNALSELAQGLILGVVQGLTEFLPISSSAHLILFSKFAGWSDQGLAFDIAANTGTLAALMVYFRRDLTAIGRRALSPPVVTDGGQERPQWSLFRWLVVATLPVAVFGLVASEWISREGRNPMLIATTSIVFGLLLWFADRRVKRAGDHDLSSGSPTLRAVGDLGEPPTVGPRLGFRDALALGVAQAIALIPGTSRSGAVITAGMFRDFDRTSAARLAFLMAIPVGVLVAFKNALDLATASEPVAWASMAVGFLGAAASGYLVIALLLEWLKHRGLGPFVAYRIALGLLLLVLELR